MENIYNYYLHEKNNLSTEYKTYYLEEFDDFSDFLLYEYQLDEQFIERFAEQYNQGWNIYKYYLGYDPSDMEEQRNVIIKTLKRIG